MFSLWTGIGEKEDSPAFRGAIIKHVCIMISVRCALQFVGDLGRRRTHSGPWYLNLAQITRKCEDVVYRGSWRE